MKKKSTLSLIGIILLVIIAAAGRTYMKYHRQELRNRQQQMYINPQEIINAEQEAKNKAALEKEQQRIDSTHQAFKEEIEKKKAQLRATVEQLEKEKQEAE
ncbi:hypothetical protein [Neptunitalea lumnitzerae]|uniref:Uncharacterized protein n=1 Tax=Neptunitalea lumnitzerae TaxID=2965509 RepID=A0ABQ5MKT9_9FLAO|nr:hypothetical protein [Neptunitalea sp. Y10]GLB49916.1 hypothetical protein Y10_22840 [Neptunitalea sp. Y10]